MQKLIPQIFCHSFAFAFMTVKLFKDSSEGRGSQERAAQIMDIRGILKFIRKKVKVYRKQAVAEGNLTDLHGKEDHQKFSKLIKMQT